MVWKAAKLRGVNPVRGAVLVGLNPLVVLYGVGGGHNDLLMMLLATGGIWALLARRERASGALIVLAAAVKLTGGVFLPFALIADSGREAGGRRRRVAFGAAVAAILCLGVGIAVFGSGLSQMINTLSTVQGLGGWSSVPGFFSAALDWETASHAISLLFGAGFSVVCVRLLWRVYRGRLDWVDGAAWATFFLLVATSSILPWYITWLLVPVALCTNRRLLTATLWFTGWIQLTTMMSYLPHAPHIFGL
jgi:alpha-1,6-mannosyltransferase